MVDFRKKHTERCKDCKIAFAHLLRAAYGDVAENYSLDLPADLASYRDSPAFRTMSLIHKDLGAFRGYKEFVRTKKLAPVDYFIPSRRIVVEFDESQHFTAQRAIALRRYPRTLRLGFNVDAWIALCESLDKTDADPVYRPEQRAWYDVLRDFASVHADVRKTVRVHAPTMKWCDVDPDNPTGLRSFKSVLKGRTRQALS